MKQTAIQQAIVMVRSRMESMNETLMGKHTAHHLQQVERGLYELLEKEKVNIESNPLNGSSFMNELRNKYMEKQTAVEWLFEQFFEVKWDSMPNKRPTIFEQAKEMEEEQRTMAYNAGHADGLCNHINDADNYINEQNYLKDEDSN
jgi:hypothetical protein